MALICPNPPIMPACTEIKFMGIEVGFPGTKIISTITISYKFIIPPHI